MPHCSVFIVFFYEACITLMLKYQIHEVVNKLSEADTSNQSTISSLRSQLNFIVSSMPGDIHNYI